MRLPLNSAWFGRRTEQLHERDALTPGLAAARSAMRAHLDGGGDGRSREAARVLCDDAHGRRQQAEQLLIALKEAWQSLPETRGAGGERTRQVTLDRFITICIEEFYARRD